MTCESKPREVRYWKRCVLIVRRIVRSLKYEVHQLECPVLPRDSGEFGSGPSGVSIATYTALIPAETVSDATFAERSDEK
jgi:hypothetical protein